MNKIDIFARSHQSRHPGESRGPEVLVFLDSGACPGPRSGIRRNDGKAHFSAFCEAVKFELWILAFDILSIRILIRLPWNQ